MISLHHSRMSVGAPVIFQRGSIQTQSTHTDRAERERAFALLLATLSQCLHEPQSRCLKILKSNAAYLSRVERYRNQPQGRAQLQKHVARFKFAQQTELSRLDAEDQRPRLVASIHAGDFIYGTNVFANYESPDTRQYVLLQKAPGEIFQRNLSQAFGEKRYSSRTQLLLESFDFAQFRRRLNSSKSSLLTFTDLPPGFGRRVQINFMGRDAWFPVGPALMAISNRMPILPLLNFSVGDANRIQLWPLIEPNRQASQSVEEAAREVTQQLSSPLQWLMQRYPEQWRFLSALPSFFTEAERE